MILGGLDPRLEVVLMLPLLMPSQPWENYRVITEWRPYWGTLSSSELQVPDLIIDGGQ